MLSQSTALLRRRTCRAVSWRVLCSALILGLCSEDAVAQSSARNDGRLSALGRVAINVSNLGQGSIDLRGTFTATVTFEVSTNERDFVGVDCFTPSAPGTAVNTATSAGVWVCPVGGMRTLQARVSSYTSGTVIVVLSGSSSGMATVSGAGGGGGTSDTTEATQLNVLAAVDGLETNTAAALTSTNYAAAFGTAGTADTQVLSVQGIASMTPLLTTATVSDGAGALNVIVDSGALTATVTDGAGALNVIIDSGTTAVTNAGTFAVQSVEAAGALLTSAQLTDNIVSVEDAVAGSAFSGVGMLAVRQDSHTDLAADGDFIPVTVDADGGLRVSIVAGAGSGGTAIADDADFTTGTTSFTPVGGVYQTSVTACTDTDACAIGVTAQRTLKTTLFSAAGVELTAATDQTLDAALVATGPLAVGRGSTATPSAMSADNDATAIWVDLNGRVHLAAEAAEDTASADAQFGMRVVAIRDDTLDARSGTEGDFEWLHTNANGALWTLDVNSAAALTSTQLLDDTVGVEDAGETASGGLAMVGTVRRVAAVSSAGTTGDNATLNTDSLGLLWSRQLDPCSGVAKSYYIVNLSTATTVELANAVASEFWYVCSVNLVAAAAQTVAIGHDDTDGCGSITAGMHGGATAATGWSYAANGGIALGNGSSAVMKSATANHYLCLITGQATQVSGTIAYVSAP